MASETGKLVCSLAIALGMAGCDQPAANTASPPPQDVSAQTVRPGEAPSGTAGVPANPPQVPPQPAAAAASQPPAVPPSASAPRIELSAAVALPQTLPDGTSILCSMDYRWASGTARQGVQYFWVIELGNGQRMNGPANVSKNRGTIQLILRGVKPEQGPFKGAIFAQGGAGVGAEQISDFIDLK